MIAVDKTLAQLYLSSTKDLSVEHQIIHMNAEDLTMAYAALCLLSPQTLCFILYWSSDCHLHPSHTTSIPVIQVSSSHFLTVGRHHVTVFILVFHFYRNSIFSGLADFYSSSILGLRSILPLLRSFLNIPLKIVTLFPQSHSPNFCL